MNGGHAAVQRSGLQAQRAARGPRVSAAGRAGGGLDCDVRSDAMRGSVAGGQAYSSLLACRLCKVLVNVHWLASSPKVLRAAASLLVALVGRRCALAACGQTPARRPRRDELGRAPARPHRARLHGERQLPRYLRRESRTATSPSTASNRKSSPTPKRRPRPLIRSGKTRPRHLATRRRSSSRRSQGLKYKAVAALVHGQHDGTRRSLASSPVTSPAQLSRQALRRASGISSDPPTIKAIMQQCRREQPASQGSRAEHRRRPGARARIASTTRRSSKASTT